MAHIYFIDKTNKWRVQIRHKGFKSISMCFDNFKDAKNFCDDVESTMQVKIKERKITFKMNELRS